MIRIFKILAELIKFNITILVLITCYLGYYLGLQFKGMNMTEIDTWYILLFLLIGSFLSSGGASVLNQYIERNYDSKMDRTKKRL